jgi:DNA-binding response OmpR family regulator
MQDSRPLRVLIVDDEPDVTALLRLLLQQNFGAQSDAAGTCVTAREKLASSEFDLITLDHQLPDGTGLQLLEELAAAGEHPPVIMVTGHGDEKTAVAAFKLGAAGYVVKDLRLSTLLIQEITQALNAVALQHAEKELRRNEERYRQMFENMSSGVVVYEVVGDAEDFIVMEFNAAAEVLEKVDRRALIGNLLLDVYPKIREIGLFEVFQRVARSGRPESLSITYKGLEDQETSRENRVYRLPSGEIVVMFDDVTRQLRAEEALRQMEEQCLARFEGYAQAANRDLREPVSRALASCESLVEALHTVKDVDARDETLQTMEAVCRSLRKSLLVLEDLEAFDHVEDHRMPPSHGHASGDAGGSG